MPSAAKATLPPVRRTATPFTPQRTPVRDVPSAAANATLQSHRRQELQSGSDATPARSADVGGARPAPLKEGNVAALNRENGGGAARDAGEDAFETASEISAVSSTTGLRKKRVGFLKFVSNVRAGMASSRRQVGNPNSTR